MSINKIKSPMIIILACIILPSCASYVRQTVPKDKAADRIIASMPEGWTLVEHKPNVHLPESVDQSHTGEKLTLLDYETHDIYWYDEDNAKHNEPLARKSINLWIMPSNIEPRYWRFDPFMSVPPKLILRSKEMKIYAELNHRVMDRDRLKEIMKTCRGIGSEEVGTVSWEHWEDAVRNAVTAVDY